MIQQPLHAAMNIHKKEAEVGGGNTVLPGPVDTAVKTEPVHELAPRVAQSLNVPAQYLPRPTQVLQEKHARLEKQYETPYTAFGSFPIGETAQQPSSRMAESLLFSDFQKLISSDLRVAEGAVARFVSELGQIPDPDTKYLICRNTGYRVAGITEASRRTIRLWEVAKDIPDFHENYKQDELLWKHLKGNAKMTSSAREKNNYMARIKRNWGVEILQRLVSISTGNSMLSACSSMSKCSWALVQRRVQRVAYHRIVTKTKSKKWPTFTTGDFLEAAKLPESVLPPTPSEIASIGCQIDEDGFLGPISRWRPSMGYENEGNEPPNKKKRTENESYYQLFGNGAIQKLDFPAQDEPARPDEVRAIRPPERNQDENAFIEPAISPPRHGGNTMPHIKSDEGASREVRAPITEFGQNEKRLSPHAGETDSMSQKDCQCVSNLGWECFSLLLAITKGNNEDLAAFIIKLSNMGGAPSLCNPHLQVLASRLALRAEITEKELAYRVQQSLVDPNELAQMMTAPGTRHWFKASEEANNTYPSNWTPSKFWERGCHRLGEKEFLTDQLAMILADFCDLRAMTNNYKQKGFASVPGIFQSWMHRGAKDELSIYEIALREAWVYNHHASRVYEDPTLLNLQFGVVQQALRSSLLLYVLLLALRDDDDYCLYAYPSPAEFPMAKGVKDLFTVFESPARQYNLSMESRNSLVHCASCC